MNKGGTYSRYGDFLGKYKILTLKNYLKCNDHDILQLT